MKRRIVMALLCSVGISMGLAACGEMNTTANPDSNMETVAPDFSGSTGEDLSEDTDEDTDSENDEENSESTSQETDTADDSGSTSQETDTTDETERLDVDLQTASEAFSKAGIWYETRPWDEETSGVGKNEGIPEVFVFDGKGNVTVYETEEPDGDADIKGLTFADLQGLSDDEVIEIAKELDHENFKAVIEDAEEESGTELLWQGADSSEIKSTEYEEPEPEPFQLHVYTDSTGNDTEKESLFYHSNYWETNEQISGVGYTDENGLLEMELERDNYGVQTVYDMNFHGYGNFVTKMDADQENLAFTYDKPGTDGVDVD